MITEKTVFILGAGASIPYGFPSARQLRKEIIDNYLDKLKQNLDFSEDRYGDQETHIVEWARKLTKKFDDSGIYSIDNFLARNKSFLKIGKLAIISFLLEAEAKSKFNESAIDPKSEWYSYLYNKHMINELTSPNSYLKFKDNKIQFITFNYERSLEMYFYKSLSNSYENAKDTDIIQQINGIKINHVYGQLGNLSNLFPAEQKNNSKILSYGEEINFYSKLEELEKNINIMIDDIPNEENLSIIDNAQRIFVLGFGFDEMNFKKIDFFDALKPEQKIYATTKGLNKAFIDNLKNKIIRVVNDRYKKHTPNVFMTERNLFFEDMNCLELLETYL